MAKRETDKRFSNVECVLGRTRVEFTDGSDEVFWLDDILFTSADEFDPFWEPPAISSDGKYLLCRSQLSDANILLSVDEVCASAADDKAYKRTKWISLKTGANLT